MSEHDQWCWIACPHESAAEAPEAVTPGTGDGPTAEPEPQTSAASDESCECPPGFHEVGCPVCYWPARMLEDA